MSAALALACTPTSAPSGGAAATSSARAPAAERAPAPPKLAALASTPAHVAPPSQPPPKLSAGGKRAVRAEHGLVTSVEDQATRAGVAMLEQGGNAVDAAVASAYALAVTHPSAGNIGGGGFMLVRLKGKPSVAIDFRETAPAALTQEKFDAMIRADGLGPNSVGVPGSVAGLNLALQRYGKLSLKQVLAPAIRLAKHGHRIGSREGMTLVWNWKWISKNPELKALYGDGNKPKKAGQRLKRPDLAATLQRIADQGNAGFYSGETARRLVQGLGKSALLSLDDLKGYKAVEREPLRLSYRGLTVETMPPPSAGGPVVALSLNALAGLEASQLDAALPEVPHLLIEVFKRAQAERRFGLVDPDSLAATELARRVERWTAPRTLLDQKPPIDREHATPAEKISPLFQVAMRELEHTTHLSTVDAEGNVVSLTTTLSAGFGSKLMPKGSGVVLNNAVASFASAGDNLPKPGRRTVSSMAPTLVLSGDDPVLVLGSPGGDTIPSTVVQVLINCVDRGMTIDQAVDAPRVHHGFVPDEFRYERSRPLPSAVRDALVKMGHVVSKKRIPIGDANDILIDGGVAYGYCDPREGGLALAAKPSTQAGK